MAFLTGFGSPWLSAPKLKLRLYILYTHTHTHTHIYIYIYIYISAVNWLKYLITINSMISIVQVFNTLINMRVEKYTCSMQTYVYYYCSNSNHGKILLYIYDWALYAQKCLVGKMQIIQVHFMQISHVLHDDCRQKRWNAGQRSSLLDGIVMMLVNKQTITIIYLANCCAGEAEPAGQTVMERRWRRRKVKQVKVMKCCLSL